MDYNKLRTDELIEIIVSQIGVPLPTYDYNDTKKYKSKVPVNIPVKGVLTGTECMNYHDTFKDACLEIITWYNQTFRVTGDGKVGEFVKPLRRLDSMAVLNYLEWRVKQLCEVHDNKVVYSVRNTHKFHEWVTEDELFEYWKKENYYI